MAVKKKSRKGKPPYSTYAAADRQAKNQAKKRARHLKNHPNDAQSATKAVKGYKRKKPVGKNTTTPKWNLRDKAGNLIEQPSFEPWNPKTQGHRKAA